MAAANARRKPRIRKSAPTVRQRAEAAQAKVDTPKPRRARKVAGKVASPLRRLRLPRNGLTKPLFAVGRFLKKILGWLVPKYFVHSFRELKLVTWPSRLETWRLTLAVFIFAAIFGALVAGVDKVLDIIFKQLILK
ncbi:MAG TPA: preprotein translocase subunit SecE [Candidatus Binatia bacterium]|nr:preprotein translocase subunit SecE [Candidatus Binatia bacterium]